MADSVYLVSAGSYSDFEIVAAFSTREKAQAYLDDVNGPEGDGPLNKEIEEYALDRPREELPGCWAVVIDEGGAVAYSWRTSAMSTDPAHPRSVYRDQKDYPGFMGYGRTEEHARRSAEELRRRTLTMPVP